MAAYAGTTYETFFRVMDQLTKENLIRVTGKSIQLLDTDVIRQYGLNSYA
ncbi:helix-turn-helix domain-containing protein [Parapedobacter lycopersici]